MVTSEPDRPTISARDWKDEGGWYPDPTGRYALRSWNGSSWSDQVRPRHSLNSERDELTSEQLAGLPSPHPDEDLTTGGPSAALLFHGLDASAAKDWDAKRERAAHIWSLTLWNLERAGILTRHLSRSLGRARLKVTRTSTGAERPGLEGRIVRWLDTFEASKAENLRVSEVLDANRPPEKRGVASYRVDSSWTFGVIAAEAHASGLDDPERLEALRPQADALLAEWNAYVAANQRDAQTAHSALLHGFVDDDYEDDSAPWDFTL